MEMLLEPEGDVLAEHRASYLNRVLAVIFLILPGLVCALAATQVREGREIPAGLAVALIGLGALGFAQQNKSRVVVRADGVERWGLRGKLWARRWADLPELRYRLLKVRVYHVIPAGTYYYLTFRDTAGKKRHLPGNLKAMDVLAERVVEHHTTAHFAAARKRLDDGEEVRFGKAFRLDKDNISTRKLFGGYKPCPLEEIERVTVDAGVLKVRRKNKTFAFATAMVGAVPNVFLLLRLLDSLVSNRQPLTERAASVA